MCTSNKSNKHDKHCLLHPRYNLMGKQNLEFFSSIILKLKLSELTC